MVKLNGKRLFQDRDDINKRWDILMNDVKNGRIDKEIAIDLMNRMNVMDKFLNNQDFGKLKNSE